MPNEPEKHRLEDEHDDGNYEVARTHAQSKMVAFQSSISYSFPPDEQNESVLFDPPAQPAREHRHQAKQISPRINDVYDQPTTDIIET